MNKTQGNISPVLRFQGFSENWNIEKLGSFLSFKNGINADKEQYGSGYKFINVLDIIQNTYISHEKIIGSVNVDEKVFKKNEVVFGDILFQRSSEIREETGQSNVYLDEHIPATFGGFVIRGRSIRKYQPIYLNYLLKTWLARKEIVEKSGGSTRYNVGQKTLAAVNIYISANDTEQQKIDNFLSSVDKKIKQLTEKQSLLQQYKKGIMQKLFAQEICFKGEQGNDFPDWEEKSLAEVLTPKIREVNKPSEKYLAIGIRSHMKGTFQKPGFDPDDIAMEKLFVLKENDLVVNITFAWEGAIAIVKPEDDGGLVSHRFPTYTFKKDQATHEFFRHIIMQKRFKYMLDVISPGGAGRNRVLSKKEFLKLKWTLPSVAEQNKIALFLGELDKKIDFTRQQIEQTKTFKKGLLQQMFV